MKHEETLAREVVRLLTDAKKTISTAESCTGGLLSALITDVSGASAVFTGGIAAYSNEIKMKLLGVKAQSLERYGAVSETVAVEMAQGVRELTGTDFGIGITGIAGPLSDSTNKPVGLIYIAVSGINGTAVTKLENKFGSQVRANNRLCAVTTALEMIVASAADSVADSN